MSVGGGNSPFADWAMQPSVAPFAWNRAVGIANTPFSPYKGTLSAREPRALGSAVNSAYGLTNYAPQQVSGPMANAAQVAGVPGVNAASIFAAPSVSAQTGMGGIDSYMNPYTQQV